MDLAGLIRRLTPAPQSVPAHPVRARVVAVRSASGRVDASEPRCSVDVQPLLLSGEVDPSWPIIPEVALPSAWAGDHRMVGALPPVGTIVRLGFEYGDRSQPYVDAILSEGTLVPAVAQGEYLLASSADVRILLQGDRVLVRAPVVEVDSPDVRLGAAAEELVRVSLLEWASTHIHPTPDGPSGPPTVAPPPSARATGVRA